jgi:hypothetical protein
LLTTRAAMDRNIDSMKHPDGRGSGGEAATRVALRDSTAPAAGARRLDLGQAREALDRVGPGLEKYQRIQSTVWETSTSSDRDFQRFFNGYYRVRRSSAWQATFYAEMEREKQDKRGFEAVLRSLHAELGSVEASFVSKLVATVNPALPVIDKFVLSNTGFRLPSQTSRRRLDQIVEVYDGVRRWYADTLASADGSAAVAMFDERFPDTDLTPLKKIDLILWQMRS